MYLKKSEITKYSSTTCDGTKENPIIKQLPFDYKLPIYLGYSIKWDLSYEYRYEYNPYKEILQHYIYPVFKKSHERFNCSYGYVSWDFLMETLLPKMENDGLVYDYLRKIILDYRKKDVMLECLKIINKQVLAVPYPFYNVVNPIAEINPFQFDDEL